VPIQNIYYYRHATRLSVKSLILLYVSGLRTNLTASPVAKWGASTASQSQRDEVKGGGWRRLNAVVRRCYALSAVCKTFEVSQIVLDLIFSRA